MTRLALLASIACVLTLPAAAQELKNVTTTDLTVAMRTAIPVQTMPHHKAMHGDGIALLSGHGKRFEKAIRLIQAEAEKPHWGWDTPCGHEDKPTS